MAKEKEKVRVESKVLHIFRSKCEVALSKISTMQEFRDSDKMIDFVFKSGRDLFENDLDKLGEDWLIRKGGRLTGIYAYLGNKTSLARAERDIYAQKLSEVTNELVLGYLAENSGYKVTHAKAMAKGEVSELEDLTIAKEADKNNYENILSATERMIGFIQSAIKVKEGERYRSKAMENNG